MTQEIKIGDWVNSYSKGIYRVEKIIEQFYDESSPVLDGNKIGDKVKDRIVISKRLLNSSFKKALSYESCIESFVSHLETEQNTKFKKTLTDNPQLLTDINDYKLPTTTTVYNYDLKIDNDTDLQTTLRLIDFIKNGKTFLEIENEMKRLDILRLKPKHFGNYSFQLFNFNEEYVDRRKIWRDAKLTKA